MRQSSTAAVSRRTGARSEFALWGGEAAVVVADRSQLEHADAAVRRTVETFDLACSSFRADSELALVNASTGAPVVVSSLLLTAVRVALRAARETRGAVDPTVGQALIAHGVLPRPTRATTARIERVPGYAAVKLDEGASTIQVPRGVRLDLGATGKALAADMAAAAATSAAGCGVLVSLCGDVAVAGEPPADGWQIRVTDDHRHGDAPGQTVTISDGGLATSSAAVRRGDDGVTHHLIDPATGLPTAGPWRTATAAAGSCAEANTASTAAIVLGATAPTWLEARQLPCRLIGVDATVRYIGGWPTDGDDL
jgi:thiamine biosynthesis lipoprotein ApbE